MMNQVLMDTQSMVGLTVVSALALTVVVLSIRTILNRKAARVPVRVEARR